MIKFIEKHPIATFFITGVIYRFATLRMDYYDIEFFNLILCEVCFLLLGAAYALPDKVPQSVTNLLWAFSISYLLVSAVFGFKDGGIGGLFLSPFLTIVIGLPLPDVGRTIALLLAKRKEEIRPFGYIITTLFILLLLFIIVINL